MTVEAMVYRAKFSDKFFNHKPACNAYAEGDDVKLLKVARRFHAINWDCPMTPEELVADFMKRV